MIDTIASEKPLAGVRVLDIATFIAAPFSGSTLAEFGAEVIKVEQPGVGDPLRYWGTQTECGDSLVWLSEARNKKSITLDLRLEEGRRCSASWSPSRTWCWRIFAPARWRSGAWALKTCAPSTRAW